MQGVSDVLDGGSVQFLTDNGMQTCDVTGFQKISDIVYILFTSCGRGRLVLQQESQQGTQGMRRKLFDSWYDDYPYEVVGADISFGDVGTYYEEGNDNGELCHGSPETEINGFMLFSSYDDKSFWICEEDFSNYGWSYFYTKYTSSSYCLFGDDIFNVDSVVEMLQTSYYYHFSPDSFSDNLYFDAQNYCSPAGTTPPPTPRPATSAVSLIILAKYAS